MKYQTHTASKDRPIAFERATKIVAERLALFRKEGSRPTANETLIAGHLVGALWANDLLNAEGEQWVSVEAEGKPASLTSAIR